MKHCLADATVHFWKGGRSSTRLGHAHLSFFQSFAYTGLTTNISQGLIAMSVERRERLQFRLITLFIVFFGFIGARDI